MTGQFILNNPKVKIGLVIVAGVLLIYLAIGSWLSKIHVSEKKIDQAWLMLKTATDQRVQLIMQFGQLVQTYAPQAYDILQPLAKSYQLANKTPADEQILNQPASIEQFVLAQKSMVTAFVNMDNLVAGYPTLAQNRQYLLLKMQLHALDDQIKYAQNNVDREVSFYNYHITGFPQGFANAISFRYKLKYLIFVPLFNPST